MFYNYGNRIPNLHHIFILFYAHIIVGRILHIFKIGYIPQGRRETRKKSVTGEFTIIRFINKRNKAVKLFWIDYSGKPKFYGMINSESERRQNTYEDAVWMITNEQEMPLGYFVTGRDFARAIIPK